MDTHRRGLLAGLGLTAVAAPALAQTPAASAKPSLAERLATEAAKHQQAVSFGPGGVSGPGFDRLADEARAARFFLLGEEHGLAQVPALVTALLPALKAAGYGRLGLEVSPPTARALDTAARGGVDGLKALYAAHPPGPAFCTMAEEARMLAAARAAFGGKAPALFGLDYEISMDRMFIDALRPRVPASARAAFDAMDAASKASWAKYAATKNLTEVFCFSGDPALVRAVRSAWPKPSANDDEMLETLEQSLIVNQHYAQQRYFQSNDSRAGFNRANWARYWRAQGSNPPRMMLKFGAGHMVRGRSMTEVYDIGSIVSETAALRGEQSVHLLMIPANGGKQAVLNPETFQYGSADTSTVGEMALEPFAAAALPGASTLFDLRPLRSLMSASVTRTADPRLARVVHGYDMLLLVDSATASGNL